MYVNKRLLVHSVQVAKPTADKDLYGQQQQYDWQELVPVRFEDSSSKSGSNNQKDWQKGAKLFVYPEHLSNDIAFDDSWLGGKVKFNGVEHEIIRVNRFDYPLVSHPFCYEIEVR